MEIKTNVEFGRTYEDRNSGLIGIAVTISKYEFGCIRVGLQAKVDKDNKIPEIQWFDEEALIDNSSGVKKNIIPIDKATGGPAPIPRRNKDC